MDLKRKQEDAGKLHEKCLWMHMGPICQKSLQSSEPGETEEGINAANPFHGHESQHSSLGLSQMLPLIGWLSHVFCFGNRYSSRSQKTSQILYVHGLNIVPFDSLPSNFIHFLIAYISTSV